MTLPSLPDLPVTAALPELLSHLERGRNAVLIAPPGAGKTTLVPLALLDASWRGDRKLLLLEPRRLAARAAARRMASLLGEEVGGTVGYAMRMDRLLSAKTRIVVVTEGVLARMIIDDPELPEYAAILFDEFHERSLDGDFGLALSLDIQQALRPDLRLLVMSATLEGGRMAEILGNAAIVESEGRAWPVEIRYEERSRDMPVEQAVAAVARRALASEAGSILAFLPGQREIERTAERLAGNLPVNTDIAPLFGNLDGRAQDAAIRPPRAGRRKVVLATSIAETSITIDGVRIVIDSGLSRVPKFEPSTGLTRLETVRVSRASADQRAGRAGRTEPGVAIRLWRAEQTASLPAFAAPEMFEADLSSLMLDCAAFGVSDPASLRFPDPPPAAALAEARALLVEFDAIDASGRITQAGQAMRRLALPPRLAHMVALAARAGQAKQAAELAVLLTERGLGGNAVDLDQRLLRFRSDRSPRAESAKALARRIARTAGNHRKDENATAGALLLHAWPDRVARARGGPGRYVLANGRGGVVEETEALAREEYLVVADLQGGAANSRIAGAAAVSEEEIRAALSHRAKREAETIFDPQKRSLRTREVERLGALTLAERQTPPPSGDAANEALLAAIRTHGLAILPWEKAAVTLRERLGWLHRGLGAPWPDMSDEALLGELENWLLPFLPGKASLDALGAEVLRQALLSRVPHALQREVDRLAPTHFRAPSGSAVPIRYDGEQPLLSIRVQELFGLDRHPAIAGGTVPLTLELLSPAHRPIQTTRDLPGFWRGSWADVRADMRGRYPKHVWPENPLQAQATARAKPRAG
ncbi:MAG: ATP-dependent helicase HrpB [Rhizobiales bacterium 65-79]|jgi:ATP-dependent helicase HrpB|nr:ATP-dependent helicase HrpB [Hyphomicrobiales bacterium]OJU04678.1 MAG: ATP-dependent helicase HrpB [Rhizobiales bacterium 65-79]